MLQIITEREDFKSIAFEMMQWAVENLPAQKATVRPDILTGEELCKKLDVTLPTLLKWRHKGKIPYLQIGSSIRYDFNKVIDAIEVTKKRGRAA